MIRSPETIRSVPRIGGRLSRSGERRPRLHRKPQPAGLPDGLGGEEVPLVARIGFACDAYSAMTTDTPYPKARSQHEALAEMERCAGTQFDPTVVEALLSVVSCPRLAARACAWLPSAAVATDGGP
ncbi:MAG: HD-GYP domain-containing protein [Haloechinothrix sp.]